MATHSSVLACRIPGKEEPGGLPSMGSHRVRHDWSDLAAAGAELWRDITSLTKAHLVKAMVFPVAMYGCESCIIKKAECRRIDAFQLLCWRRLEGPLDHKKIKSVNPKGDYSLIFIGRSDAEAEAPVLWPPDAKNWLIRKYLDAGKDWKQEYKGMTEDEMVGWHHWLDGYEFEQAPRVGDGQGSLACCSPWGHRASDMTELTGIRNTNLTLNVHDHPFRIL